jgi:two-component system, OmpR family, response regulator
MNVLVVEDEVKLAALIHRGLVEHGYRVDVSHTGEDALDWVAASSYDVIVLDVMLPGISGIDVCRTLRRRQVNTPVLMLTARDAVRDRVTGLDAGADDYMVKPFSFAELLARLRALTRRPAELLQSTLEIGDLRLDPSARRVWRGDREIVLPNKEFRILEYFMRNPDRVLTRTMIADHVWDYDFPNVTNVIDVHIRLLRGRLDDPVPNGMLQTVRGAGYRLAKPK